ncbi:unnamed protein product [Thelazia callipaeda]|uniref:Zf-C2HC5 domain-containing protein n=1 Tax=Thelazia callipaeda TaxID=103827 RepID=A0A0N5CYD2_THECL|nr:unnamed protein product [Thelazia callipaeda]
MPIACDFSDHIASRMSELLISGYTMLNEYCVLCNNILMADRQGIRLCVNCSLMNNQHIKNSHARETFLEEHLYDKYGIGSRDCRHGASSDVLSVPSSAQQSNSVNMASRQITSLGSQQSLIEGNEMLQAIVFCSESINYVVQAVEDKLKWCSIKLRNSEDFDEMTKLYQCIEQGIGIIEQASLGIVSEVVDTDLPGKAVLIAVDMEMNSKDVHSSWA